MPLVLKFKLYYNKYQILTSISSVVPFHFKYVAIKALNILHYYHFFSDSPTNVESACHIISFLILFGVFCILLGVSYIIPNILV